MKGVILTVVILVVVAGAALGSYAWWRHQQKMEQIAREHAEYISEPQQLKRACVAATWNKLIAPSTAKLVNFVLVPAAQETILTSGFQAKIDAAQKTVTDLKATADKAFALFKKSSDQASKSVKTGNYSAGQADLNTSRASMKIWLDAITASAKAKKQLEAAQATLAAFRAAGLNEIALSFDAENRASAMIRMHSVCTYKPAPTPENEVSTVVVAKLGERGE